MNTSYRVGQSMLNEEMFSEFERPLELAMLPAKVNLPDGSKWAYSWTFGIWTCVKGSDQ